MKHTEDNLQIACIEWFYLAYPNLIIHHSPNGGFRNAREAARFKKMGTLAGMPDLHIPEPNGQYHGLYIELKAGKNRLTKNQSLIIEKLTNNKYKCEVCYSLDEFMSAVNNYINRGERAFGK